MNDGIIILDSNEGKELGFTSDKFDGWLWKKNDEIIISFIQSLKPGKCNLVKLFNRIREMDYKISIPNPFSRMEMICKKYGMRKIIKKDDIMGPVECMVNY